MKKIIFEYKRFVVGVYDFLRLQKNVKTIDLEKTYESCFEPSHTIDDIVAAKTDKALRKLLKDSVYVQFLSKLVGKDKVTDSEIEETRYFIGAWNCVGKYGSYQGRIKDKAALVRYCRDFLKLYVDIKGRVRVNPVKKYVNAVVDHYKYGYPHVFLIADTQLSMVYDGAHRLACLYVLGQRYVKVKSRGTITGPIKITSMTK